MRALFVTFAILASAQASRAADLRYFDDAALRAVQFVDAKEGWAVGDEGVILHTIDGGQTWERQATGLRASLRSLVFLNPYVGWAAGREELPRARGSAGVLLFTRDGGLTWQRLLTNALPGLNQVKFTDPKNGFVFGDGIEQFATGVFKTSDGGRTWEPVPGPRSASWLAGDFQDGKTGILAGAWSRLATLRGDTFGSAEVDTLGGRSLSGLTIMPQRAVAVGQGGLILTSVTGGMRWGFADLKLPKDILAGLDFNAIHAVGPKAWVVGRPGSVVFHTADSGVTWALLKTGQALPLHGVFFLNEKKGWAVGELGTILTTGDGGQSWQGQHQGGKRTAACFVHAQPEDVPFDTLALLGAQEGYLLTGLSVVSADPASSAPVRAADPLRFAAAVRRAGGAAGEMLWHFPLPQHLAHAEPKDLLRHWNQNHNDAGREMLRQLVLALRIWRPDVLLTNHPGGKSAGNAALGEALLEAARQAADAKAFPEQLDQIGLAPWRVKKLYYLWDKNDAQVVQDNNKVRSRLEASAADYAAGAADLLCEAPRPLPGQRFYRLVYSTLAGADKQHDIMLGMAQAVGETRRAVTKEEKDDPELHQAQAERQKLILLAENLADPNRTLSQIAPTLAKLPDDAGARTAFAVANQYVRKGQWALARETFLLMADRYPSHPLTVDAYRWLIRHISSSEARRRQELGQFRMAGTVSFNPSLNPKPKSGEIQLVKGTEVTRDGRVDFLANQDEARQWFRGSLLFGQRLAAFGPLYGSDPAIQFCLQASRRQLGEFAASQEWYNKFRTFGPKGPWSDAAAAELWLMNRGLPPPKRLALCRYTSEKPYLDGKFDDPCWKGLQPMTMENAVGETAEHYPTQAHFAYDQDFLYIALRCKHPAGLSLPPVKNRTRDANLDPYDRVSILLDLDRDYSTYYQLQVDQRGCVRDDCWGDLTWDPRWFVAVHTTDDTWQIEAALPLTELTGERIRPNTAWAVNVVRTLPGRGVQAWSLPADVQPRPEGMSLMIFHQEAKTR
jgi:photosystem II stability/assembly factor-like uncharacterized protein/TolA-binding protein